MADIIVTVRFREAHRTGLAHYVASGHGPIMDQRIEVVGQDASGREFPIELTVTRLSGQRPYLFSGFIRDISERKKSRVNPEARRRKSAGFLSNWNDSRSLTGSRRDSSQTQ